MAFFESAYVKVKHLILFFSTGDVQLYREVLKEDASGSLQASIDNVVRRSKRQKLLERPVNVRLGMVSYCFYCVATLTECSFILLLSRSSCSQE